jgi:transposase InsO family protein
MQTKLAIALARRASGERLNVAAACAELGVSRPTFYKYARRFDAEGIEGLFARSRRPAASPAQTSAAMEDLVIGWRKRLGEQGWDNGAASIHARMRRGGSQPPSIRTIHRILVRRGQVIAAPHKRPRSSYRRFEFARTNECWQADATECQLADGSAATVFHLLDDCSRRALASVATRSETAAGAWLCLSSALASHGVPAMFLSDNGSAFSAKVRGGEAELERHLRALGVNVVTSSPRHPQTCGKVERYHQTFKRWLAARPQPAGNISELQTLAESFDALYNTERPHSALAGATPAEVWAATEQHPPPSQPLQPGTRTSTVTVSSRGEVRVGRHSVQVGRQWEGAKVTTIHTGDHASIFHKRQLVRSLNLDTNRRYQPLGTAKGRPRRPRVVSTQS